MSVPPTTTDSVLILGAGIHGAAIALELVLNGVAVHLVEKFDLAYGATSKSSRLIHGGLRYLEYGDFRLVRESLEARSLNLSLTRPFVQPLRLFIPTAQRWSGLLRSGLGFFQLTRTPLGQRLAGAKVGRGFWPLRIGLALYDALSPAGMLPKSSAMSVGAPGTPRVNPQRYRWLCSYSDAQMLYPERLVLALLAEAQEVARERGVPFQVSTYSNLEFDDGKWRLRDTLTELVSSVPNPASIVNATGAWGDGTLGQLRIATPPLFGGTKGTHFVTWNENLKAALQGQAVYAEADDGRLVFILPFGDGVLVGTTDETFAAKPETAVATEEELEYLLDLVNGVMDCRLTRDDITLHYSGVRPLPKSSEGNNAAVSRDHRIVEHRAGKSPVLTLVGGKLTTWREFADEVCARVFAHLGHVRRENLHLHTVLGQRDQPAVDTESVDRWGVSESLVAVLGPLYGCRMEQIFLDCRGDLGTPIRGTPFTSGVVRWIIEHEWVRTLSDLVERRLMLVFARELMRETLEDLADCLVAAGVISGEQRGREISSTVQRLSTYYGRRIED